MGTSSTRKGVTPSKQNNPDESKLWRKAKIQSGKYFQQKTPFEVAYKAYINAYESTTSTQHLRHNRNAIIFQTLYDVIIAGLNNGIKPSLKAKGIEFDDSKKGKDVFIDYVSNELCPIGVSPEDTATREETLLLSLKLYDTLFDEEGFKLETINECTKLVENIIIDYIAKEMMNDFELALPTSLEKPNFQQTNKQREDGLKKLKLIVRKIALKYSFNYKDSYSVKEYYDKTYLDTRQTLKNWSEKNE